jgi:cytochrome c-type biogenesis protein CcmH
VRGAAAALAATIALAAPAGALAADCPRASLGDIEDEVMCPVCGTPLGLATEAPQAQRERAFIEELIADCRSKQEIKTALVAQFGDGVLALPGDEGGEDDAGDVLVYAIPALAFLAAAGCVALAVLRWRRGRPAAGETGGEPTGSARLEADLERYDL